METGPCVLQIMVVVTMVSSMNGELPLIMETLVSVNAMTLGHCSPVRIYALRLLLPQPIRNVPGRCQPLTCVEISPYGTTIP